MNIHARAIDSIISARRAIGFLATVILISAPIEAQQTCYRGVCFPSGDISFADSVLQYIPDLVTPCIPMDPNFKDPLSALGPPDYPGGSSAPGSVSLGEGGLLELIFQDNLLANSGDSQDDLHIFEVGPVVEAMFVALRPENPTVEARLIQAGVPDLNNDGFYEVARIAGSTSSVDIDSLIPGFAAQDLLFDAVQLIDEPNTPCQPGSSSGADIDAVGAIFTKRADINTVLLVGTTIAHPGRILSYELLQAPPNSPYWILRSARLTGSTINGHPFDIGPVHFVLASGMTDSLGRAQWSSQFSLPVLWRAATGRLFWLEARVDSNGRTFDSNYLPLLFP